MLGPAPTDAGKIVTLTSGTCEQSGYLSILDKSECAALAIQLMTQVKTPNCASTPGSKGKKCAPVGCYKFISNNVNNGKLYFNTNLQGTCTDDRQCLCKGNFSLLVCVCMYATLNHG